MALKRLGKSTQSNSSTLALIECSVRVSPTLARLIRKSAEKEISGSMDARKNQIKREYEEDVNRKINDKYHQRQRRKLGKHDTRNEKQPRN